MARVNASPSAITGEVVAAPKVTIKAVQAADYDATLTDPTTGRPFLPRTFMVNGAFAVIGGMYEVDAHTAESLAARGLAEIVGEAA